MSPVRMGLVPLFLLLAGCGGSPYAIQPEVATQLDDTDWVIKRKPTPPRAVPSADGSPPPSEAALPAPGAAPPLR